MISQQKTVVDESSGEELGASEDPRGAHVLVMSADSFTSVSLPLEGSVEIGRSNRCAIQLQDPLASREHARLHVERTTDAVAFGIEDLASANGTRVGERALRPGRRVALAPGEAVTIGRTVLMVQHGVPWSPQRNVATAAGPRGPQGPDEPLVGASMKRVGELARRAASRSISVLILGETGTGKDVLARTIHELSGRKGPFVALNCASIPETLVESELFGYEKGAFSGASSAKMGLLESGNGGTVFLDEIGEMPLALQPRLLRALETREILPVGGVRPRPIDVRFLAATHRDLQGDARSGSFRSDLFFRLNALTLPLPPLRERREEIPALVQSFLEAGCRDAAIAVPPRVSATAMKTLLENPWPGNIRELRNVVERALVFCDGAEILPEHLWLETPGVAILPPPSPEAPTALALPTRRNDVRLGADREATEGAPAWSKDPQKVAERERMVAALDAHAGSQTRAAQFLGMPRRTFVAKLRLYRIPRPQRPDEPRAS